MSILAPPKKPVSPRKKNPKKKQHWWQWPWFVSDWSKIVLAVSIFTVCGLAIVLVNAYLSFSKLIDRKLSGEIFQDTARVYSAPLTIFRGQLIRKGTVTNYLTKARYSEKGKGPVNRVGEYIESKRALEIFPK